VHPLFMIQLYHMPISAKKILIVAFTCLFCLSTAMSQVNWKNIQVLVYTKSDSLSKDGKKLFVHDNIAASAAAVQQLGKQHGFKVDVTNDPAVFTEAGLPKYTLLVFTSTNNDVFNTEEQRVAFRRYIESGGGFVGLHSVMGTERNWTWFKNMLGGTFVWHANNQVFTVRNIKPNHPSVKGVPLVWELKDECYFAKEMYPGIEVVMAHDIRTLSKKQDSLIQKYTGPYNELYPAVWYHHFDGGHIWVSQLGHDIANYTNPVFVNHIFQGMTYIASLTQKRDNKKAYATQRDTPLQY